MLGRLGANARSTGRKCSVDWAHMAGARAGHHLRRRRDNTDLCYLSDLRKVWHMPTDGEITFADHVGRFYARRYAMAPMVGRLIGYLAVCEPREQSTSDLADALLASRSAIAGAVSVLERLGLIQRTRTAGERMDRVRIDMSSSHAMGFDVSEYLEMASLAREGLRTLADAPPERRAVLLEWEAFSEFLVKQLPSLEKDWIAHREALRAAGELPDDSTATRGGTTS
jgi:hypothetical protein